MANVQETAEHGNGEDWIGRAAEAAFGQEVSDKAGQRGEEPLATLAPKPNGLRRMCTNLPPVLPPIHKAPTYKYPKISGNGEVVSAVSAWEPFPMEVLPQPARDYVQASSAAIGCDVSYIALPLLASLAAAISNSRRLQLKRGWTEPALLCAVTMRLSRTPTSP